MRPERPAFTGLRPENGYKSLRKGVLRDRLEGCASLVRRLLSDRLSALLTRRLRRTHMTVKIQPNTDSNSPSGKLADVELHFTSGELEGLRLLGFAIWERRTPAGRRNVTFPARAYTVNGERRTFALLRPLVDPEAQDKMRDSILAAYEQHEAEQALAV